MKAVAVTVADGVETIRVESSDSGITLTNGTRWSQVLTRKAAWRLAEAIDAVATMAPNSDQDPSSAVSPAQQHSL